MADLFNLNKDTEVLETPVEEITETEEVAETEEIKPQKGKKEKKSKKKLQYLEPNKMNFLERYEIVVEGKKPEIDLEAYKTPIIIVIAIIGVLAIVAQVLNITSGLRVKSLEKYINNPTNIATYNEALDVKAYDAEVKLEKANMEKMIAAIATYPDIDSDFFAKVHNAASTNGVKINNYGYSGDTGFLSTSCTATSMQGISNFVRSMRATGLFVRIDYTGFTSTTDGYSFTVSVYCKEGK